MTDDDGRSLSRRLHWDSEDQPGAGAAPEPRGRRETWDAADERWDDERAEAGDATPDTRLIAPPDGARSFERRDLDRMAAEALDRRRQLWRDTAMILSIVVGGLLVANLVSLQMTGAASASPSPAPSEITIGTSASPGLAGATAEPVENASPGSASPVAKPDITLPPTGTSAPATPRPTPRPTRRPTPPTAPPTPAPTSAPTLEITPPPTEPPPTEPPPTPQDTPPNTPTPST